MARTQATGDPAEDFDELVRLAADLDEAAARGRLCTILSDTSDEDTYGDVQPNAIERAMFGKDAAWIAATRNRD